DGEPVSDGVGVGGHLLFGLVDGYGGGGLVGVDGTECVEGVGVQADVDGRLLGSGASSSASCCSSDSSTRVMFGSFRSGWLAGTSVTSRMMWSVSPTAG